MTRGRAGLNTDIDANYASDSGGETAESTATNAVGERSPDMPMPGLLPLAAGLPPLLPTYQLEYTFCPVPFKPEFPLRGGQSRGTESLGGAPGLLRAACGYFEKSTMSR